MKSLGCFVIVLALFFCGSSADEKPNIVFILADDLGFNDVSFHGSPQIPTPVLDDLANNGVILNNYYVQHICTPTRSALMTGKYPIHLGMQHDVIIASQPFGLGLDEILLPQHLKKLGYVTHGVGKWHLGFYKQEYTPIHRGFDSFYGYWSGKEDYWDHANQEFSNRWGLDLHDNDETVWVEWGNYSTYLFTDKAVDVINKHNTATPLFLYLPYQSVHSANTPQPLQAPDDVVKKFGSIENWHRRIFAGMVSALDTSIKRVVDALKDKNMYKNTIIVFSTDNGGPANGYDDNYASNFPLRGVKKTLWEGGIRGAAFIHSPLIKNSGRVSTKLLHVTDWLPTLYVRAGGDIHELPNLDGVDMWDVITNDVTSPRMEILHNIDPVSGAAAYRFKDWKLIVNQTEPWSGWYPPPGYEQLHKQATPKTLKNAMVTCSKPPSVSAQCTKEKGPCLFDISTDPCEYVNLAANQTQILKQMLSSLEEYKKGMVPIRNKPFDENSSPRKNGGAWVPWQ